MKNSSRFGCPKFSILFFIRPKSKLGPLKGLFVAASFFRAAFVAGGFFSAVTAVFRTVCYVTVFSTVVAAFSCAILATGFFTLITAVAYAVFSTVVTAFSCAIFAADFCTFITAVT